MKKLMICIIFMIMGWTTIIAQNDVVDNKTVIELLKNGFGSDEIIGVIENSTDRQLTFSISYMMELKEAGADSRLITFIQKITKTDFGYEGILWWNVPEGQKPVKLYRTSFEKEFSKGWGGVAAIVGQATGLLDGKLGTAASIALISSSGGMEKVVMQGKEARTVLNGENSKQPVFRFYFPQKENNSFNQEGENWYTAMMTDVESPNEFQCIKMKQKKSKRTFPDGISYSVGGFSAKKSTRDIIEFEIEPISNNIFEVRFKEPLEPGEYCFFYKHGAQNRIFAEHMFGFDFSVQ